MAPKKESLPETPKARALRLTLSGLLGATYLAAFACVFGIADISTLSGRSEDLPIWTFGLATAYWAGKTAIVLGWVTLLPAWALALREQSHLRRTAILFAGIVACLIPVWSGALGLSFQRPM